MIRICALAIAILVGLQSGCSSMPRSNPTGFAGLLDGLEPSEHQPRRRSSDDDYPKSFAGNLNSDDVSQIRRETRDWRWPLNDAVITSGYGERGRRFHEGVDLRAKVGTPIYSVDDGKVVYKGSRISGYGRMLVVEHDSGIFLFMPICLVTKSRKAHELKKESLLATPVALAE